MKGLAARSMLAVASLGAGVAIASPAGAGAAAPTSSPCTPIANAPGTPTIDPAATATFGPLAPDPALRITSADVISELASLPGGVLVGTGNDQGQLTAITFVEDSGAIGWRACPDPESFPALFTAPAASAPTQALVVANAGTTITAQTLDLATGAMAPVDPAPGEAFTFGAASPGFLLLRPDTPDGSLQPGSTLPLLDLATMTWTTVPVPDEATTAEYAGFVVSDEGVVGLSLPGSPGLQFAAAYVDGAWSNDAAAIDAAFGPFAMNDVDAPISLYSASGAPIRTLDVYFAADEGFHDMTVGGVVLMRACTSIDPATYMCEGEVFMGLDAVTGDELWRYEGSHWVPTAADGYALVGGPLGPDDVDPDDVQLIDVATGLPVDGQAWPAGTFWGGCCGDPAFTTSDGGVVFSSDGNTLSVWYPAAAGTGATVDVTL